MFLWKEIRRLLRQNLRLWKWCALITVAYKNIPAAPSVLDRNIVLCITTYWCVYFDIQTKRATNDGLGWYSFTSVDTLDISGPLDINCFSGNIFCRFCFDRYGADVPLTLFSIPLPPSRPTTSETCGWRRLSCAWWSSARRSTRRACRSPFASSRSELPSWPASRCPPSTGSRLSTWRNPRPAHW